MSYVMRKHLSTAEGRPSTTKVGKQSRDASELSLRQEGNFALEEMSAFAGESRVGQHGQERSGHAHLAEWPVHEPLTDSHEV